MIQRMLYRIQLI